MDDVSLHYYALSYFILGSADTTKSPVKSKDSPVKSKDKSAASGSGTGKGKRGRPKKKGKGKALTSGKGTDKR